jgi:uncharacterized protein
MTDISSKLIQASADGNLGDVRLYIELGADVNAPNQYGARALHYAAARGTYPIVKALLDAGANRNATNSKGQTPLNLAVAKGRKNVEVLLRGTNAASIGGRRKTQKNRGTRRAKKATRSRR